MQERGSRRCPGHQSLYPSPYSLSRYRIVLLAASICVLTLFAGVLGARHGVGPVFGVHQGWQNTFDFAIESHLNHYVNRWPRFDSAMLLLVNRNLLKGAPIVFLCWAAFFEKRRSLTENRAKLVATIPLAIAGVVAARVLAKILPFRERPFRTIALHFQTPHGMSTERLYGWSSFPSDHAVLFIALAVGVFFASRRLGLLALGLRGSAYYGPARLFRLALAHGCADGGSIRGSLRRRRQHPGLL